MVNSFPSIGGRDERRRFRAKSWDYFHPLREVCKLASTPFRMNTNEKTPGWGGVCGKATLSSRAESRDGCALRWVTERGHSPYNVRSTSGEHTMNYRKFGRTGWN